MKESRYCWAEFLQSLSNPWKNHVDTVTTTKLSQENQGFCEIFPDVGVVQRESQGCLPIFNPMQVQDIDKFAPFAPKVFSPQNYSTVEKDWGCLPFHWLSQFDRIDSQFSSFQVWFEDAIALHPSNPRFLVGDEDLAIMPTCRSKVLNIKLGKAITQVQLWLSGSAPVRVSAFDKGDRCVATVQTPELLETGENLKYPAQLATLDIQNASYLRIDSKSPYILTRFFLKLS